MLCGTAVALLKSSKVQDYLIQTATSYFSTKFGTKVQIASVDLELFNKVSLHHMYIEDLRGDTLLFIDNLKMGFKPLELLQNRFICNYLELDNLSGNLVLDKKKVLNLTFILDALKSDNTTKSKLTYQLEGVQLVDSKIRYTNENELPKVNGFDPNNVFLTNLNAKINLHKLSDKYLSLEIKKFGFKEKSGFELSDFTAYLRANKSRACIENLSIALPHSAISFTPISIYYENLTNVKSIGEKGLLGFMIKPSEIALADLKAFIPAFARTKGKLKISTHFKGTLANMRIKDLSLSYDNSISLKGNFELSGLSNLNETFVYAKIKDIKTDKNKLQDLVSDLVGRPFQFPEQLNNLGTIHYKGDISGFFSDLVVFGTLKTDIGQISTDILMGILPDFVGMDYSGSLHTDQLKLGTLFGEKSSVGNITFNLSSKGSIHPKGDVKGLIEGNISSVIFKDYTYKNIILKGAFDKKVFDGMVNLDDEFAKLNFNGKIDLSERLPSGKFKMTVRKLNLYKLNLIKTQPDLSMAFNVNTSFIGSKLEDTDTDILIDSVYLSNKQKELFLEKIYVQSKITDSISELKINSDLVNGKVKGKYSFMSLGNSLTTLISNYLPSIKKTEKSNNKYSANDFVFFLTDFHVDKLADILDLNLTLSPKTLISGFYNDKSDKFRLEVLVPKLQMGKSTYVDLNFLCNNQSDAINVISSSQLNENTKFNLASRIANDSIQLNFDWRNPHEFSGKFSALSLFSKNDEQKLQADIQILPSQIWLKDSLWDIHPCNLKTNFKSLQVSDFILDHKDQFVKINGIASALSSDSLHIKLKDIQLNYVMDLVKVKTPIMEAHVTGDCVAMSVFSKMILQLNIFAKDFTFNHALWGDVKMKSVWDDSHKKLIAKGYAYTAKDTAFFIGGEYYPKNDSLEFYADAKRLELNFLRYYLDPALQRVSGDASGRIHLFGTLKNILFEGDVAVKNGRFDVDYLRTAYHFTDTIHVKQDALNFNNITLYDSENNSGILNGTLTHKNFKDMRFRFDVKCKNVLAMNTMEKDNENFYGKAYGSGNVRVQGTNSQVNFTINMKTEPNTKIVIPMITSAKATENSFVQFVTKPSLKPADIILKSLTPTAVASNKNNIHVYLQIEATPDAEIKLITDPVGGDYVSVVGNGNLRIDYDNTEANKLYGNFEVESGEYIFTLQQVVRKTFTIKRGGTMRWTGNPYLAIIDLNATYTVPSVSLLDILEESQLKDASRTSMPINCLLNLTGDLMQPTIKFDFELPSDPELQISIKSIVNTEEMMNREMLALLVMSRFYKPDYLQNSKTGLGTEMVSVLTTTVSGQLNNWLSKINDKLNVGLNARLGNGTDLAQGGEYKLGVVYQPNSRLVINSNVGYRNDILATNTNNFIGDVDVEYKLNKSGKVRAKGYTHSADNYFLNAANAAKTTQGVGLLYREDFNSFSDIIHYYFNNNSKKKDTINIAKDTTNVKKYPRL